MGFSPLNPGAPDGKKAANVLEVPLCPFPRGSLVPVTALVQVTTREG